MHFNRLRMRYLHTIMTMAFLAVMNFSNSQEIAILKYKGGGDWYANPTALPNLIRFCNANIGTKIKERPKTVEVGDITIYQYPFLHMTGHGNVVFSQEEADNLRMYLLSGGFLHIDDNYGMEPYLSKELTKVFPNNELEELGADPVSYTHLTLPTTLCMCGARWAPYH